MFFIVELKTQTPYDIALNNKKYIMYMYVLKSEKVSIKNK